MLLLAFWAVAFSVGLLPMYGGLAGAQSGGGRMGRFLCRWGRRCRCGFAIRGRWVRRRLRLLVAFSDVEMTSFA